MPKLICGWALYCLGALILSSCAAKYETVAHWAKPGATQETFLQDRYTCLQQAQQNRSAGFSDQTGGSFAGTVVTNQQLFISCMIARGYVQDPNGNLFPPPEAVVRAQ
jgi:hypothetical protein